MPRYKVIEQKQRKFMGGRIKAKDLERILNEGAEDGWTLDRILAGERYDFLTGDRDVFLLVFRQDD